MTTETAIDAAKIGEAIPTEEAGAMIKRYHDRHGVDGKGFMIGMDIINLMLAQPDAKGLVFYPAITESGEETYIYLAVNGEGKTIMTVLKEENGVIREHPAIVADRNGPPDPEFIKWLEDHDLAWPWWTT